MLFLSGLAGCADERPASWQYIHEAFIRPSCTLPACHSKVSTTAGLRFDEPEGTYFFLVGSPCGEDLDEQATRNFVAPGDPGRSKLLRLLRGEETRNMPPDIPLPEADIDLIELWILEGALCN